MYASDEQYEPGTVVSLGGDKEVTATTAFCDPKIAGVVSTKPAYLMNSEAEGVAVALRGRVPCKVEGAVNKGDIIVSSPKRGVATALTADSSIPNSICILGKSLESNPDTGVKLVEILV